MELRVELAFVCPLLQVAKLALLNTKRHLALFQGVPAIVKFLSGVLSQNALQLAAFD
jgi:hypothetical protein